MYNYELLLPRNSIQTNTLNYGKTIISLAYQFLQQTRTRQKESRGETGFDSKLLYNALV